MLLAEERGPRLLVAAVEDQTCDLLKSGHELWDALRVSIPSSSSSAAAGRS